MIFIIMIHFWFWYIFLFMLFFLLWNCDVSLCYYSVCSSVQSFQSKSFPLPIIDGSLHPFIRASYFKGWWTCFRTLLFIADFCVIWIVFSLIYKRENPHFYGLHIAFTSRYHLMLGANLRICISISLRHFVLPHLLTI